MYNIVYQNMNSCKQNAASADSKICYYVSVLLN